ncbi:MAG: glycosyltransferase family 4 protein [Ilumatobacter sp.]|uniref:glycosyltransferase family 4 protein n=1 Tax=Ilumatobacter sp. TaxID=1967498 RepID=UPI003C72E664
MGNSGGEEERTRLLLLTNTVQLGGMEEHVRLIAKDLDPEQFDVSVVFPEWEATDAFVDRLEEVADDVEQITPDRRHGISPLPGELWRLWKFARRGDFDVAHLHSTTYSGQVAMIVVLRLAGLDRVFVTEHLAPETQPPRLVCMLRRAVQKLATGVICVSERNRQARAKYLHTPDESTHVVVNGIDMSRFNAPPTVTDDEVRSQFSIPAGVSIIGTAIRFEPGKGVDDLVDAFAIIAREHPEAILLMVGDGSLRGALEDQVEAHGLTDRVIFAGFISDPRPLIALMDIFVLPVPFGSASIGLLEAMAMSKPCIISFGGPGEAIEPGQSGYWAEPLQPESIAEHLVHLLDDDELRLTMGANARRRVETDFSSQRVAVELSELYRARASSPT